MPLDNRGIVAIVHRRQNREILAGLEPWNGFIFEKVHLDTLSVFPPSEDSAVRRFAADGEKEIEVGGNGGWREKAEKTITERKKALRHILQCLS